MLTTQAVTLALARDGWYYDPAKVKVLQATQVSTISIFNCLGRIVGGALSDYLRLRLGMKRVSLAAERRVTGASISVAAKSRGTQQDVGRVVTDTPDLVPPHRRAHVPRQSSCRDTHRASESSVDGLRSAGVRLWLAVQRIANARPRVVRNE